MKCLQALGRTFYLSDNNKILSYEGNSNADKVYFSIGRYFDEVDLSTCICTIKTTNSNKQNDVILPQVIINESTLGIIWTITSATTIVPGSLSVQIQFEKLVSDGQGTYDPSKSIVWQSNVMRFEVKESLDSDDELYDQNPTLFQQWEDRIFDYTERAENAAMETESLVGEASTTYIKNEEKDAKNGVAILNENAKLNGSKLEDSSITSTKIANSAIISNKLADNSITVDKIANASISSDKIAENAVISSKIANNSIVSSKILNHNISHEKLSSDVQNSLTKTYGVRWLKSSNNPNGTRIADAVGLTANVGVGSQTVVNDFDLIYPWSERKRCNGYYNSYGGFVVNAYEGDNSYKTDGSNGEVWVEVPLFYYKEISDDEKDEIYVSGYPLPGYQVPEKFKNLDGTIKQKVYISAYPISMVNDCPTSRSGVTPDFKTYSNFLTVCRSFNPKYHMETTKDWQLDYLMFSVEFATRDSQSIMAGATNMASSTSFHPLIDEVNTNRVIIANEYANQFVVGQCLTVNKDGRYSISGNLTLWSKITTINIYDSNSKEIVFDGNPINVSTSYSVGSWPWKNGSCDNVAASSGSIISNTSGKYPCIYRGKENPWGNLNMIYADVLSQNMIPYICNDCTKYSTSITNDYIPLNYQMVTKIGGFLKEMGVDKRYPSVRFVINQDGSYKTYYCDRQIVSTSNNLLYFIKGGCYDSGNSSGLYFFQQSEIFSTANPTISARLSFD